MARQIEVREIETSASTSARVSARRPRMDRSSFHAPWILALVLGPLGCQLGSGLVVTGNPPDLAHIPKGRIESSMWVFAGEITRLDELLSGSVDSSDPDLRLAVVESLERMKVAARQLDTPGRSTPGHPVLGQHLTTFIERLERAKRAARRDPPDYYQASALAGGCFLCHGRGQVTASLR